MKKKINWQLTLMLVSLFIGLLLVILGNKNKYCLSFGLMILGGLLAFYTYTKSNKLKNEIKLVDKEIDEMEFDDFYLIDELSIYRKKLKKQKIFSCTVFYVCAVLLIVLGFVKML